MGEVDENGEIANLSDQQSYRDMAHMRVVYRFPKYGEDFSIGASSDPDIAAE